MDADQLTDEELTALEQAARAVVDAELFADDGALYAYHGEQCGRVGGDEPLDYLAETTAAIADAAPRLLAEVRRLRAIATHEPGRTVVNAEGLPVTYCACGLEWPCRRADRALSAAIRRAEAAEAVIKSQGEPK